MDLTFVNELLAGQGPLGVAFAIVLFLFVLAAKDNRDLNREMLKREDKADEEKLQFLSAFNAANQKLERAVELLGDVVKQLSDNLRGKK